jgi:hypothetical protein
MHLSVNDSVLFAFFISLIVIGAFATGRSLFIRGKHGESEIEIDARDLKEKERPKKRRKREPVNSGQTPPD